MVLTAFSTPQQALDALDTDPQLTVYIGGVLTDCTRFTGQFDLGKEIAPARLELLLPRPPQLAYLAEVEVQAGHNDLVGTQFSGFIPNWSGAVTNRGNTLSVQVVGWSALLAEPERWDLVYPGPISLRSLFVALCELKGVPSYLADHCTYPDGVTEVMLGGNPQIDDGQVIIRSGTSPLAYLNRQARLYQYTVVDTTSGAVHLRRSGGLPSGEPVVWFVEGIHPVTIGGDFDSRSIVNYNDVNGPTFEDQFGGKVPIRSIPLTVTPHPAVPGDGIRYKRTQSSDIVRQDQAEAIRQLLEITTSEPSTPLRWTGVAVPFLDAGDVIAVESESLEASGVYWLTALDITNDDSGYLCTYRADRGSGEALPSANDRVPIEIQIPPLHLGDETVPWYAHPAPQGKEKAWDFSLPDKVSVANVRGWHHSTNSQLVGGIDTDLQVTSWEVWEQGVDRTNTDNRPISQGKMPRLPERYAERPPFWDGLKEWVPFAINLRTLDPGDYVLVLRAGEAAGLDDFEVQLVILELFGTVEPAIALPVAA